MTPDELADQLERIADRIPEELGRALQETTRDALARAQWWSSGGLTERDLRRLDRPYAKRHGSPRLNPDFVNRQSGVFQASWRSGGPAETGDGDLLASVFNVDPKAPYLEQPDGGPNSLMFQRHPHEQVAAEVEPRFEQRVALALARSLEG